MRSRPTPTGELPVGGHGHRSDVPECGKEKKKRQSGGDRTVNAEGVNEGELDVHETDRGEHAYCGVKAQAAGKRVGSEQCRESEHVQIIDEAEIAQGHVEDAPYGLLATMLHPSMGGGHHSRWPV